MTLYFILGQLIGGSAVLLGYLIWSERRRIKRWFSGKRGPR